MSRGKRTLMLLGLVFCLCLFGVSAWAYDSGVGNPGDVVDGSVLVEGESASDEVILVEGGSTSFGSPAISEDPVFPILGTEQVQTMTDIMPFGTYLESGACGIVRIADNIAQMEGFTSCYRRAEYVYLGLYMDRLEDDGTWHTVAYKEVDALNTYYLSYAVKVVVKPGYYYRMRGAHVVSNGPLQEGNTSFTDGIKFG